MEAAKKESKERCQKTDKLVFVCFTDNNNYITFVIRDNFGLAAKRTSSESHL
jgi:hypothetical protein